MKQSWRSYISYITVNYEDVVINLNHVALVASGWLSRLNHLLFPPPPPPPPSAPPPSRSCALSRSQILRRLCVSGTRVGTEQKREFRNAPMRIWSPDLSQK